MPRSILAQVKYQTRAHSPLKKMLGCPFFATSRPVSISLALVLAPVGALAQIAPFRILPDDIWFLASILGAHNAIRSIVVAPGDV